MEIQQKESKIVVSVNGERLNYRKDEWGEKANYLTSEGVLELEEWKIDLIKNYGVDIDEIRD